MNKSTEYTDFMKELEKTLQNSDKAMMYTSFTTSSCNSCEIGDSKPNLPVLEKNEGVA